MQLRAQRPRRADVASVARERRELGAVVVVGAVEEVGASDAHDQRLLRDAAAAVGAAQRLVEADVVHDAPEDAQKHLVIHADRVPILMLTAGAHRQQREQLRRAHLDVVLEVGVQRGCRRAPRVAVQPHGRREGALAHPSGHGLQRRHAQEVVELGKRRGSATEAERDDAAAQHVVGVTDVHHRPLLPSGMNCWACLGRGCWLGAHACAGVQRAHRRDVDAVEADVATHALHLRGDRGRDRCADKGRQRLGHVPHVEPLAESAGPRARQKRHVAGGFARHVCYHVLELGQPHDERVREDLLPLALQSRQLASLEDRAGGEQAQRLAHGEIARRLLRGKRRAHRADDRPIGGLERLACDGRHAAEDLVGQLCLHPQLATARAVGVEELQPRAASALRHDLGLAHRHLALEDVRERVGLQAHLRSLEVLHGGHSKHFIRLLLSCLRWVIVPWEIGAGRIVVACDAADAHPAARRHCNGQLDATIHGAAPAAGSHCLALIRPFAEKVGRLCPCVTLAWIKQRVEVLGSGANGCSILVIEPIADSNAPKGNFEQVERHVGFCNRRDASDGNFNDGRHWALMLRERRGCDIRSEPAATEGCL